MTVEGLIYFDQKEDKVSQHSDSLSKSIFWNGSFLKVICQNDINFKYQLSLKVAKNLQKPSSPFSIDSKDWEGFFLLESSDKLESPEDGITVTYSSEESICEITRDTFGLIPLYYFHSDKNFLAFSTSLTALLQIEGVLENISVDTARVMQYLAFRSDSLTDYAGDTFFTQIKTVLPGHKLTATADNIATEPYIRFRPENWNRLTTLPEFAQTFRQLFTRSVAKAASNGVIGAHLSGGMDSSSISAVAKKIFPEKHLRTFHAAPNTKFASENEYAQAVADLIRSEHYEVAPSHNDFEFLTKFISVYGHPECMITSPALQGSLMEAARSNGCTALLIGHDGDSVVGSGFDYIADLFDQRKWSELKDFLVVRTQNPSFLRLFKNWNRLNDTEKQRAVFHDFFGRRFLELSQKFTIRELFQIYREIKRNFDISTPHFIKRGYTSIIRRISAKRIPTSLFKESLLKSYHPKLLSSKSLSKSLGKNLDQKYGHSLSSVYNTQGITLNEEFFALSNYYNMRNALPFYDKDLFELCMSVPSKLKLGDGIGRAHFREAMKGILPELVRTRRDKAVFGSYARQAAIRIYRDAKTLMSNDQNEVWDYIDKAKFEKVVEILHDDKQNSFSHGICQFHILRTVSLAVWFDWLSSLKSTHLE